MDSTPARPKRFRDSAAVLLVRGHGRDLEVFWVLRSDAVAVQPGFHAFVGGKVDASDAELPLAGVTDDLDRAARACALREALEETGVLPGLTAGAEDAATLARARTRLLAGEVTLAALATEHGWRFDAAALTPAGRWQTPVFASVRFDTLFYVAHVPEGQAPSVIPGELASGEWVKPLEALERYRHGGVTFVAPILWSLIALAEGEQDLAARLVRGPERAGQPIRRIEMQWGVVLHPMPTKPLPPASHTNAYLIGETEMALVDPGSGDEAALADLFALIDLLQGEGRRLTMVVVTHHHGDHTGGVAAVRERYGARVVGHARLAERMAIDVAVKDGDWLPLTPGLSDWRLRVIETPGHTRDSISLWQPRLRSLFVGDLLPGGGGTVIIDPPDGDMTQYLDSLERVAALEPVTLFPAHGSPQGAAVRRIRQLIAHRLEREARVVAALAPEPRTLAELVPFAYADVKPELWPYAERSLLAHLGKLALEGRAVEAGGAWRRAGD